MIPRLLSFVIWLPALLALSACASSPGDVAAEPAPTQVDSVEQIAPEPSSAAGEGIHSAQIGGPGTAPSTGGISMRVLWTISGYVFRSDFTGDKAAAEAMLFKPLDITDNSITFDGQTCQAVKFQQATQDAAAYLPGAWHTTPQELGIDDQQLQVFTTNCSLPGFGNYVRLGDARLIVPMDGVFYFFEPNRNY